MDAAWFRQILVRDLETMKREIAAFPDDGSVWATPPGVTNSAGTLALHLAGNIQHFIGRVLGEDGYVRDRDREFAARGLSREELVAELDRAVQVVRDTLTAEAGIDFLGPYPDVVGGKFTVITGDWLVHLAAHLAFHLGQAGYLRRIVTGSTASVGAVGLADLATAVKLPKPA